MVPHGVRLGADDADAVEARSEEIATLSCQLQR